MTPKFAIPLVFALSTSTAVFAQDTTTTAPADGTADFNLVTIPFDWDEDTVDAFFSDPETGELRDEDEITENWDDLSEDQQDIVRQYCEGVMIDEAGMNGAGVTGTADTMPGADTAPGAGGVGEQQMAPAEGTTPGMETTPGAGEMAPAEGTTPGMDTTPGAGEMAPAEGTTPGMDTTPGAGEMAPAEGTTPGMDTTPGAGEMAPAEGTTPGTDAAPAAPGADPLDSPTDIGTGTAPEMVELCEIVEDL